MPSYKSNTTAGLAKTLLSAIETQVTKRLKKEASKKRERVMEEAKTWKLDVQGWLYRVRRGRKPGSQGNVAPFMVTGQLRRAVHYRVTPITKAGKKSYRFTVRKWFAEVFAYNRKGTRITSFRTPRTDYSDILNDSKGKYYSGYKDKAMNELDRRVEQILKGRQVTYGLPRSK